MVGAINAEMYQEKRIDYSFFGEASNNRNTYKYKKAKIIKHRPLAFEEKQEIHRRLFLTLPLIMQFEKIEKDMLAKSLTIYSYQDLYIYFAKTNLFNCLDTPKSLINQFFPCLFFPEHFAWISTNQTGHMRYFSKKHGDVTISMDFMDLLEVYYGIEREDAVKRLLGRLQLNVKEQEWIESQNLKYRKNHTFFDEIGTDMNLSTVSTYVAPYLEVWKLLNEIGLDMTHKEIASYKGDNIFFVSSRYLSAQLGTYSTSMINKIINGFCAIGLMRKVPTEHIPADWLREANIIATKKRLSSTVSFYTIPSISDNISSLVQNANILKEAGLTFSQITSVKLKKVFENHESLYIQPIQAYKKKRNVPTSYIQDIEEDMKKLNFLSKEWLGKTYPEMSLDEWRLQVLPWLNATYDKRKPTKKMKNEQQLLTNNYVYVPKRKRG